MYDPANIPPQAPAQGQPMYPQQVGYAPQQARYPEAQPAAYQQMSYQPPAPPMYPQQAGYAPNLSMPPQQVAYYQPYQVMTPQGMQTVVYYPVEEEKKDGPGRKIWRIIYPLLAFFGLQLFASIIGVVYAYSTSFTSTYFWDNFDTLMWEVLAIGAVADVIMIPLCIAFLRMDENRRIRLGTFKTYTRVRFLPCAVGLAIGIAMAFLASGIFAALGQLDLQGEFESYAPNAFWAYLIIGILAPVTEELLFRVVIYSRLRESLAPVSAGLVCALIFALAHGSAVQGVTAFFYGLALCLAYEHWKSYVPVLLMHMGINCTVITVAIVSGGSSVLFTGFPLLAVIVASALVIAGCVFYILKSKPAHPVEASSEESVAAPVAS